MFLRVDKLQVELPASKRQDPNAAAALQELLGGKYGEMSTLGQRFSSRSKSKLRPFDSLVTASTAEELGHVELVSNGVAWGGGGETALPGELEVVDGLPDGGKIHDLTGVPSAFTPDYAPEELFEIAAKLYHEVALTLTAAAEHGGRIFPRSCG